MAPETSFLRGHKRPRTAVDAPQQSRALRHRRKRSNIDGANDEHDFDKTKTFARRAPQGGIGEINMCYGNLTTAAATTTNGRTAGNMFDVKTNWNRLYVNGIDIHSDASQIAYEVYTRPGSFEGGQLGIDGWIFVERGSIKLKGELAPIRWDNAVEIGETSVQAFYVTLTTQNLLYHVDSALSIGAAAVGNEKLYINIGVGVSYPLGQTTNYGVLLSGTLHYKTEGMCPSDMEFGTGSASVIETNSLKEAVESLSSEMPLPLGEPTIAATPFRTRQNPFSPSLSQTTNSPLASSESPSTIFEFIEPSSNRKTTVGRPSISTTSEAPLSSVLSSGLSLNQRAPTSAPSQQGLASGDSTFLLDVQSEAIAIIPPHRPTGVSSPLDGPSASSSKKEDLTEIAPSTASSGEIYDGNSTSPTASLRRNPDPTPEPTSLRDSPMPVRASTPDVVQVSSLAGQSGVPSSSRAEVRTLNPIICDILPELCVPTSFPSVASQTESPSDSPAVATLPPSENIDVRPVIRRTQTPIIDQLAPSAPPADTDFNPTVCILIPALCTPTISPSNALPMPPVATSDPESTPSNILSPSPTAISARTKAPIPDPRLPSIAPAESAISPSVCFLIPALCAPTASTSLASPPFGRTKMPSARLPSPIIASRPSAPPLTRTKVPTLDPDRPPFSPTNSASSPSLCIEIPDLCTPSIAAPTLTPSIVGTEQPTLGIGPASSSTSAPTFGKTKIPSLDAGLPSVSPAESHASPAVCLLIPALCAPTESPSIPEPKPSGETGKTKVPTLDAGVSSPSIVISKTPVFGKTKSPSPALGRTTPPNSSPTASPLKTRIPVLDAGLPSVPPAEIAINPTACILIPALCAPTISPSRAAPESVLTLGRTNGPTPGPQISSPVMVINPSDPTRQRTKVPKLNPVPTSVTSPSGSTLNPSICILIPELCAPFSSPTSSTSPSRSRTRNPSPSTPSPLTETTDNPVVCILAPELCAPAAASSTSTPSTIPTSPESRPSVTLLPSRGVSPSGSAFSPAMSQSDIPIVDPLDTSDRTSPPSGSSWPSETPSSVPSDTPSGSPMALSPFPQETPSGSSWPSETPSSVPSEKPSVSLVSGTPSSFPSDSPSGSSWPSGNPSSVSPETPSGSSWPSETPSSVPSVKPSGSSWPSGTPSVSPATPSDSSWPSSIPPSVLSQKPSGSSWPSETPSSVPAESTSGSSWPSEFPSSSPSETPISVPPTGSPSILVPFPPLTCPGFVKGQNGTAEQILDFSYRVETSTSESTFLSDVESAVLLEVSKLVLNCQDITGNGRFLQANDQGRIYQVGYPESGAISATSPCTPTEPSARYCFDIDSRLAVVSDDRNESAARAKVQQAISDVFVDSESIEKQVPGAIVYQVEDPGPTTSPVSDTESTSGPSPLVISLSVVLGIMVLVAVWFVYRWRRKPPKRGKFTTPAPFPNDDDDLSTNLVDKYNSQNGDPEDDYSRYGYESAAGPISEHDDEYRKLIGSSPDKQRDSDVENAATYEDYDEKVTSDEGNADANDYRVTRRSNSEVELMPDEKFHVTEQGLATEYIDEDTAISVGSDLTENHGFSAPDIKYESAISMAHVFDDADRLGEAEATAFAMTSVSSVTDLEVVRSLLLLPIVKILFGNPSEYLSHDGEQEMLSLTRENAPCEGRESIGFSASEKVYDDRQYVEDCKMRSSADFAPDYDEKGVDRSDQSYEYGSKLPRKFYSEFNNLDRDPLPLAATVSEADAVDENAIIQDDVEATSQPGDGRDTYEGRYHVSDHDENESYGSLDESHSYSTGGEGAGANNGTSFVVVEDSASRMDNDANGFVMDAYYDESDQAGVNHDVSDQDGVNYNESDKIDTKSNKGDDAHSITSYEENIAFESSNFSNDHIGIRSGRQYHDGEPEETIDQHRYKYDNDNEDMDSRQGSHVNDDDSHQYSEIDDDHDRVSRQRSHFNDDSHLSEIDVHHVRLSRQGIRFNDDSLHSEIDDGHDRVPRQGSHFNDDSYHSGIGDDHDRVPRHGSHFNDDSLHREIGDGHGRVPRQGSQFNDDSYHSRIGDDHDRVSRQGSHYYDDDDSRHREIDGDQEKGSRQYDHYDGASVHSDNDD